MPQVTIRHDLRPGDLGMVVHLHGLVYAREFGLDTSFEPYVARPLAEFVLAGADAGRLWIVEEDVRIVGSIAIVKTGDGVGQLRWFLLVPGARGHGLGGRMLADALTWARSERLSRLELWTFGELDAAIELYRRHGFVEAERVEHVVWGARRTEMRMSLDQVF